MNSTRVLGYILVFLPRNPRKIFSWVSLSLGHFWDLVNLVV